MVFSGPLNLQMSGINVVLFLANLLSADPTGSCCSQIARPALFDQAVVNSMVTDMEKVELSTISVQPLLSITAAGEHADTDVYSECKSHSRSIG